MKKKILLIALLTGLMLSLNSCIFLVVAPIIKHVATNKLTIENKCIPPDFGKKDEVLLLGLSSKNNYDKYLKKNVKKLYTGKYKLIKADEINNSEYSDLEEYRYFFYFDDELHSNSTGKYPTKQFWVFDRLKNKKYYAKFTSGFFTKVMQGYLINLNKEFLKNKDK